MRVVLFAYSQFGFDSLFYFGSLSFTSAFVLQPYSSYAMPARLSIPANLPG